MPAVTITSDDHRRHRGSPGSVFALACLAGAAVLAASFVNFLRHHDYPLLRSEIAIVLGGMLLLAAIVGATYAASGRTGRALLEGLLVLLALDINGAPIWIALVAGLAVAALSYWKRTSLLPILALLSTVVLLTTLLGLGERRPLLERMSGPARPGTSEPPILHIVLDEHIGSAGILEPGLRAELERFYTSRGFRLFARAYSNHFHTINAMPDILSLGGPGEVERDGRKLQDIPRPYFNLLARRGYAFNFYQSEYIDFCARISFASCTEYVGYSLAAARDLPLSPVDKARLAASKFAALSRAISAFSDGYDILIAASGLARHGVPLLQIRNISRSSTLSAMAGLDALAADLRQARPGNVYFAHLLFPHYPYVARPDCSILPPSNWEYRRSGSSLEVRREAYRRQLRCALRKIDLALTELAASPAGARAIVVVHGDHGSRITQVEPRSNGADRISPEDLVAGYSTLFAARAPGLESGVDRRSAAAPDLLRSLARSGFRSAEIARRPGVRTVMLDNGDWVPTVAVPLPAGWQDPPR